VVPVAALGKVAGDSLTLEAMISHLDGEPLIRRRLTGPVAQAVSLGTRLAEDLLDLGGREILANLRPRSL